MSRPRICIAHQTVTVGDAIGNDIAGAYRVLQDCGYEVLVACEYVHPEFAARHRVHASHDPLASAQGCDALLYHHSVHWPRGEDLVERFRGAVVVKYHNITPPHFFAPYSEIYRRLCTEGRAQTARLAALSHISHWQSDSGFNAGEIRALGVPEERCTVVPPFGRYDEAFRQPHEAAFVPSGPFHALFVGRRVPNKGHVHLLRTVAAWRELFPEAELRCRIIGAVDPELDGYYRELADLEARLGISDVVEWYQHLSDARVAEIFRTSHVYVNLSEHEGFCVPVVEAQAIGMPTLSTDVAALPDTAGPGQILVPLPGDDADYDFIAGLLHEICVSAPLRESIVKAGCANVYRRFASPVLVNRFVGDLEQVLRALEPA